MNFGPEHLPSFKKFFWRVFLKYILHLLKLFSYFRSAHHLGLEEKSFNDAQFSGKFSYWANNGTEPLKNLTIGNLIKESVIMYKDRIAVSSVHQGVKLTYTELHNQVTFHNSNEIFPILLLFSLRISTYLQIELFSAGLVALSLKKGDHVGIWAPNNVQWFVSIMAIIKAGFIAVSLY